MERSLPTILCIHGHGTNAAIFRLQARRIVQALQTKFHFVFVDAPFSSLPGPGVVPVFSGFKPFLRWHCDEATLNKFDITPEELEHERRTAREMLADHIAQADAAGGPVVGVMAFSQGTRVATGLMLDPELGRHFQFAVLICGTFPALPVSSLEPAEKSRPTSLAIPTIHVQGSHDPWAAEGRRLKDTYFDAALARVVKFNGGHQVPAGAEATQIAAMVEEAWSQRK